MKPLIILLGVFALTLLFQKLTKRTLNLHGAGRFGMAAMLIFTTIGHFLFADGMVAMIPEFVPFRKQMVWATGVLEFVFAIGLLSSGHYKLTGRLLAIFFVIVLPANINAAIEQIDYQTGNLGGPGLSYLWFRIPLQVFFILWVYFSAIRNGDK